MMWDETRKPPDPMTPEEEQEIKKLINDLFGTRRKVVPKRTPRKDKRKSAARLKVKR